MFVGWIRKGSIEYDLKEFEKSQVTDKNLILNTAFYNQSLCFGAYEENTLVAIISAYMFENSIFINNFYYQENTHSDTKKRLIKILLNNVSQEDKSLLILVKSDEKEVLEEVGFKSYAKFSKAIYKGGAIFNFSPTTARAISNENYLPTLKKVDAKAYGEDRVEYVTKTVYKSSSLLLSTNLGYQHSYAISKDVIKLSPWLMEDMSDDDAQKIMRGVIYHRGLKKIIAFIPSDIEEITKLYQFYKFELIGGYELMYKNKKPNINLEMIYGL